MQKKFFLKSVAIPFLDSMQKKQDKRKILKNFWLHCVFFIEQREKGNGIFSVQGGRR